MELSRNANRFTGKDYLNTYATHRPETPESMVQLLRNYSSKEKISRLIDLGCGPGNSTHTWLSLAKEVIGVDPSEEMLDLATARTSFDAISFTRAFGHDLPFPNGSAQAVVCSQSFHWMEPQSTLSEVSRVLSDDGILAIYDVIWPVSTNIELERAYLTLFEEVDRLTEDLGEVLATRWPREKHLYEVRRNGGFAWSRQFELSVEKSFSMDRFIGLALSQGGLEALIKRGVKEAQVAAERFVDFVKQTSVRHPELMTYHYRVVLARKLSLT